MVDLPPHLYRQGALAEGRDTEAAERAIEVAGRIRVSGAYPVYTLSHLARLTGASWSFLRDVAARRRDPYLDVVRPKRDRAMRSISSPQPVLMEVQRWLLRHVVSACEVHSSSYAYQEGRSIVTCARRHVGARWLIKLDIHDFFESVGEKRVYRLFQDLGYPRLLSLEMARLCTRVTGTEGRLDRVFYRYPGKAPYAVERRGALPQGAPTSGMLANAVMAGLDRRLDSFARSKALTYTRYSDDLTFSAGPAFDRRDAGAIIQHVGKALAKEGFRLHRRKIRVIPPGARHVVLGLLVDDAGVRLLPEYKRRLEVHVRGVAKFGLAQHAECRRFNSVLSMINHVDGSIAFAESVEPAFAATLRGRWNEALSSHGFPA